VARVCKIEGCGKPHNCRGWCRMHYARWQRFGDRHALRPNAPSPLARFTAKVEVEAGGCWRWLPGPACDFGYGNFWLNGTTISSHRASYLLHKGPIPDGLVLDHLCSNPICVNPAHLEPVTQRVNLLRGRTFQAGNASKTHCVNGHEFTPENTYYAPSRPTSRACKACQSERTRQRWLNRRSA
jgi:hypothetical protein